MFLMKVLRKIPTQLDGVIRVRCDWSDETHGSFHCIPISLPDHRSIKDGGAFDKCQNVSSRFYPRFDISNVFRAFIVVTGNFTRIIDANKEENSIQFIIQRSRLEKTKTKEELNVKWM